MTTKKMEKTQMIVQDIISKILGGEYTLNSRLPTEMNLASTYGVGRSLIREALSVLKSLGIITSKQGGGNYVTEVDSDFIIDNIMIENEDYQEIKHLFELRIILESEAAYLAAERRTQEDVENLQEALHNLRDALLLTRERSSQEEDFHFHKIMIRATHNPVMIKVLEDLSEAYMKTLSVTLKQNIGLMYKRQLVYKEHEDIFEAIKDGKAELAKVQCKIHLENVQKKINYLFKKIHS